MQDSDEKWSYSVGSVLVSNESIMSVTAIAMRLMRDTCIIIGDHILLRRGIVTCIGYVGCGARYAFSDQLTTYSLEDDRMIILDAAGRIALVAHGLAHDKIACVGSD